MTAPFRLAARGLTRLAAGMWGHMWAGLMWLPNELAARNDLRHAAELARVANALEAHGGHTRAVLDLRRVVDIHIARAIDRRFRP